MAEPANDYQPDVGKEIKDARDCLQSGEYPEKPHYTTEEKLMSPGPGPEDEM